MSACQTKTDKVLCVILQVGRDFWVQLRMPPPGLPQKKDSEDSEIHVKSPKKAGSPTKHVTASPKVLNFTVTDWKDPDSEV